ncbi:DUF4136 domain-containing protein [Gilvibacter sp.]|uniref:DUF4136 domain-containing protein n=1 Tax=Gilvibacter sp. TaxID=2729997 RepID=UPI0025BE75CB|nr:DUF4136 domain-containing protein [Gilvibacter sp.]NQX76772.1 DUF4136 domain-containing protein [Gilvibacter sp.]
MENVKYFNRRVVPCFVLVFLLLVGCGPTARVDFDPATNFTNYKTYKWFTSLDSGLSELDNRRVKRSVDSLLQSQGFIESEAADFMINFYAVEEIVPANSIGIGIGSGGEGIAVGGSGSIPVGGNKILQTLTLDFVDPVKDELIWQGVSVRKYFTTSTPEQKAEHYLKVAAKLLRSFPPQ